jgi:RimJ/RimL family protein N-acetyltransferase
MTEMEGEKYLEDFPARANSVVQLVIEAIEDNSRKVIGSIGLDNIGNKDHNAHFWIVIGDKDYWSKGFGTEAARLIIRYGFEQLNLHRISSYVYSFNERSLRLHSNVGFTEESRQREASFKNGKYYDNVNFGILKEEWLKLKNGKIYPKSII